jgi:hypothetical protein
MKTPLRAALLADLDEILHTSQRTADKRGAARRTHRTDGRIVEQPLLGAATRNPNFGDFPSVTT